MVTSRRVGWATLIVLFCVLSASLAIQKAAAKDFDFRINTALEPCSNTPTANPNNSLLRVTGLIKAQYASHSSSPLSIRCIKNTNSSEGFLSYVFIPSAEISKARIYKQLAKVVHYRVRVPFPPAKLCHGGMECCSDSPSAQCLLSYSLSDESLEGERAEINLWLDSVHLLGQEIARNTLLLTDTDLENGRLPGDELLYIWRFKDPEHPATFMVTRFDAELVDRLATTVNTLLPLVRSSLGVSSQGADSYDCGATGFIPSIWSRPEKNHAVLEISRGEEVRVRNPSRTKIFSSVVVATGDGRSTLRLIGETRPPIGGENQSLVLFFKKQIQQHAESFPCLTREANKVLNQEWANLNSPENAVVFFYLLFLDGIWSELKDVALIP